MYAADTMAEAARRFDAFIREAKSSLEPELHRLAKTMTKWRTEILAHHRSGASNGPTEADDVPPGGGEAISGDTIVGIVATACTALLRPHPGGSGANIGPPRGAERPASQPASCFGL